MTLKDKIFRFFITHIPFKVLKEDLKRKIFIKYNFYGKNNKIFLVKDGKKEEFVYNFPQFALWISGDNNYIELEDISLLKMLKIDIKGNGNHILLGKSLSADCVVFDIVGDNNDITLKQNIKLNDVKFDFVGNHNNAQINSNVTLQDSIIDIEGCNNKIKLDKNITFKGILISMLYDKNLFYIKTTLNKVKEAKFYIEEGSKVYIGSNSDLRSGNLYLVANGNWGKKQKLIIGNNVKIARDAIIRTSDGHSLIDRQTQKATNPPQDTIVGDNVWIASRCILLKGARIPDNSMVGAMSLINKQFFEKNIMLIGIPAKIVRRNIHWDYRDYGEYMKDFEGNNV